MLKPKSCIVEAFLVGRNDVGGTCPSPSNKYNNHCCCSNGCCWEGCPKEKPPQNCLDGVPNSQWVFNKDKVIYQAVRNFKVQGMKFKIYQIICICILNRKTLSFSLYSDKLVCLFYKTADITMNFCNPP